MPYNQSIPQPNDDISVSQGDLLNNFMALYNAFNTNHGDFNSSEQGQHKLSMYFNQASDPTTAMNQVALYAKEISGAAHLFVRNASDATPADLTITHTLGGAPDAQGSFNLPCNMKIIWRTGTVSTGNGSITQSWAAGPITVFGAPPIFTCAVLRGGASANALFWVSAATASDVTVQARMATDPSAPTLASQANFLVIGIGAI